MARKGENIYKRKDGRWEARYEKGRNEKGKIVYGFVYANTYQLAKQKKYLAQAAIYSQYRTITGEICRLQNSVSNASHQTVNGLCEEWLNHIRHSVKDSTYANYNMLIHKHIIPELGNYRIDNLTTPCIHHFVENESQKGLANSTIKSILVILKSILKYGESQGKLSLYSIQFKYPKTEKEQVEVFTEQERKILMQNIESKNPFELGILVCMFTGLRVGELCGLKWQDIDFKNEVLHIERTVSRIICNQDSAEKTEILIGSPKTDYSKRDIPIPDFLLTILKIYRRESSYYLLTGTLNCMEPRNVQKRFKTLLKRCGIPNRKFHALRHSFATMCIEKGFDIKTLSELLGHASVKTTMDIYVHSNLEQKKTYMNRL